MSANVGQAVVTVRPAMASAEESVPPEGNALHKRTLVKTAAQEVQELKQKLTLNQQMMEMTISAAKAEKLRADDEQRRADQLAAEAEEKTISVATLTREMQHAEAVLAGVEQEKARAEQEKQAVAAEIASARSEAASAKSDVESKDAELVRLKADIDGVQVRLTAAEAKNCCSVM